VKLTKQDIKLLSYLYHSSREPITKIAKECKLSREQVNYKLKKFQEQGLIKGFLTLFNYPSLGYLSWSVMLIKSHEKPNLTQVNNLINFSEIVGNYNYFVTFISKNEQETKEIIQKIIQKNNSIVDYNIITPYFLEMFPLKFLHNKQTFQIFKKTKKQKLSIDDKKILKILEKDARIKIVEIANKLNISAELALYKLKNLQKKNIIVGTKTNFDISKLGFHYSLILINLFQLKKETEEKIKVFAKENTHVNSLMLSINQPQVTIQIFHKTQEELIQTIEEIKQILKKDIKSLNLMFPKQEKEINTLPTL